MRMGARIILVGWLLLLGRTGGEALAYVGVDDPCPWPTPSPPDDAGWAEVHNAGFEEGFLSGVALGWTGWKHSGLTGTIHYAGSDQKYDGVYSQKLIMPQPTSDGQEAGVYQRVYVVPGQSYTATVRVRLHFPVQDYNCQDLQAWLGLDPFGEDSGNGSGMVWYKACTQDTWIQASVTATAVLPTMTVSLKATRTWPWHGDGAIVWFDHVTFSGPVPTEPPPGPGDNPVDPETLIPATFGPNVVSNPSFEEDFIGDIGEDWNKWWTLGSGEWKRSQRVGKVGGAKYDCGGNQENVDMRPKTVLLLGGNPEDGNAPGNYGSSEFFATFSHMQDTIIVGRPFVDSNYGDYYSDPTYWGARLADQCKAIEQDFPRIDCWQALNEPDWDVNWQKTLDFEYAFASRCREVGIKSCVLNLATGNPGNIWQMTNETYSPHCGELLAIADYLGHHVYGGPSDQLMVSHQDQNDACSFALRPRRFKDMYDRRGWRFPPVIATEGSTFGAWNVDPRQFTNDEIVADLTNMGGYMTANTWWCGYTNFVVGALCSWPEFDIVGEYTSGGITMAQAIGNWNYDHPADAMEGYYSQVFGAGEVHPTNLSELAPEGLFNGGINQQVSGLIPGEAYLLICWMKYEFRGHPPEQLRFYLGVDSSGQTSNGGASTIDWGIDQVLDKASIHETFTHVWRTFTASTSTQSIWLRSDHPLNDPSFKCYVDMVEVRQLDDAPPSPYIEIWPMEIEIGADAGNNPADVTFSIRNGGIDTINYQFVPGCSWVSTFPAMGASSGETDTIQIVFDTASLAPGEHRCVISTLSAEAGNAPFSGPTIILTVTGVAPDFDQDGDVDQADFGHLQACFSGAGVFQGDPNCTDALLDEDDDVDQDDFGLFQSCFGEAGVFAPANCDD